MHIVVIISLAHLSEAIAWKQALGGWWFFALLTIQEDPPHLNFAASPIAGSITITENTKENDGQPGRLGSPWANILPVVLAIALIPAWDDSPNFWEQILYDGFLQFLRAYIPSMPWGLLCLLFSHAVNQSHLVANRTSGWSWRPPAHQFAWNWSLSFDTITIHEPKLL